MSRRSMFDHSVLSAWAGEFARSCEAVLHGADAGRRSRGLVYARTEGMLDDFEFGPGEASVFVAGSRGDRYLVYVHIPEFDVVECAAWDYVVNALGFSGELAEGRFTRDLLEHAVQAGCDPVPSPDEIAVDCDCPDAARVCKHIVAALVHMVEEVDTDEAVLLRLRGITEGGPSGDRPALRREAPEGAGRTLWASSAFDDGPSPAEAFARRLGPLPEPPEAATEPEPPCFHPGPFDPGRFTDDIDADALDLQAALAANAASDLLFRIDHGLAIPRRPADLSADAARLASHTPELVEDLASAARCAPAELEMRADAWFFGGEGGLAAFHDQWKPGPELIAEAEKRLTAAYGEVTRRLNRWTVPGRGVQYRLGRDGVWYPYARSGNRWIPSGHAGALDAVIAAA